MAINFTLEESTRQDIVALASLRIRRDHRQAPEQSTPGWEAVEYLIRQEKLDDLLAFYLALYEIDPTYPWGTEPMTAERFTEEAPSRIREAPFSRPGAITSAFFLFQKEINAAVAPEIAGAVGELYRHNEAAHKWDSRQAQSQAQSATN